MAVIPAPYRLNSFGGLAFSAEGRPLGGVHAQPRRLALLALLARAGTIGVSRDRLQALLWPESDTERARHSLNQLVHLLRRELRESVIQGEGTLRLDMTVVSSDLRDFLDALEAGEFERAIARYAGPFLDGFHLNDAAGFDEWVEAERAGLRARATGALAELADQATRAGKKAEAVRWRQRAWELDPLDASAVLRLMQAEADSGDVPAAKRHAQRHAELLRRLELEPDPSVMAFAAELEARPPPRLPAENPPHATSERERSARMVPSRSRRALLATALLVTALLVTVALAARHRSPLDPKNVLIAGFVNRTNDSALDPIGDMATDYVARGIAATQLLHEVFDGRSETPHPARPGAELPQDRELARRLGAGTMVVGRFYRVGDSLRFETQLVNPITERILLPLAPAAGSATEVMQVIELLRQRVMAGFGVVFGMAYEPWQARSVPPTYDAYREILAGTDALWSFDYSGAVEHYQRAAQLDSTYSGARTALVYALARTGDCRAVDSLSEHLTPLRDQLPPFDRGQADMASAICKGDLEATLSGARGVLAAAPRSFGFTVLTAVYQVELFEPLQALATLARVDPQRTELGRSQLVVYWSFLGYAYHMVRDYAAELRAARAGLKAAPADGRLLAEETVALAALARPGKALKLAQGWLSSPAASTEFAPGELAECVALELGAHGQPEASRQLLDTIVAWYAARNLNPVPVGSHPCLWHTLSPAYYAGRWDSARAQYRSILASDAGNLKAHAALGVLAVRRGDQAEADRMDGWLASRPGPEALLGRARIAALRGDPEGAVKLLRGAFTQGLLGRMFLHIDPDLNLLQDHPSYRELVRPRG